MVRWIVFALVSVLAAGSAIVVQAGNGGLDGRLVCTRTGETLETCCCRSADGQLVCGKTGEVLESCCCEGG